MTVYAFDAQSVTSRAHANEVDPIAGLQRRGDLLNRPVGMDLALYDPATRQVHLLNAVATAIWHHIEPGRTLGAITDVLAYTLDRRGEAMDELKGDVIYFIRQLHSLGLLLAPNEQAPSASQPAPGALPIPDRELSCLAGGYIRPSLKSFTIEELRERFALDKAPVSLFADTWDPNT